MNIKRTISMLLALVLILGLLPVSALAEKNDRLAAPVVTVKNITASGKIRLVWEGVEDAVSYKVYRASSQNGKYTSLGSTESEKFTDPDAVFGKTYYYRVKAIAKNSKRNSPYSDVQAGSCKLVQPKLTITGTADGKVKLSWKAVSGAKSYDLYRSADGEGWTLLKNVTKTSYTNSSVDVGTTYYYQIQAIASKAAANSALSEIISITAPLCAPAITVKTIASGKPTISWEAIDGAVGYEIFRATKKDGTYKSLGTAESCNFVDETAVANKTYYYSVIALAADADANSVKSDVKSALCKLAAPTVSVENNTAGKPVISWDDQKEAKEYKVYRASSKNGEYSLIKTTSSCKFSDTSATGDKIFYYKVKAIGENTKTNSSFSESVSIVCKLPRPTVSLSVSAVSGKVIVSWKEVTGAVKYGVYRSESQDGEYELLKTTTSTKFTDDTGDIGVTYYYKVQTLGKKEDAASALSVASSSIRKLEAPAITLENDQDSGNIILSWPSIEGARSYAIYRSTSKSGTYKLIWTSYFTQYTDTTATAGKTYYYKIRALAANEKITSSYSTVKSCICKLARVKLEAGNVASSGKVKLSWSAVPNVRTYNIYRATSASGDFKLLKATSSTNYTDTATKTGKTYYYKVRALASTSAANGPYSAVVSSTGKLTQPTITLGKVSSKGTFKITWAAVSGAKSYNLYRSTDKENWELLKSTTGLSHTTEIPTSGVTYYFRLQAAASKDAANSAFSKVQHVSAKLKAPTITVSLDEELGKTKLSWEAVNNAVSYTVYRSATKNGTYTALGTAGELSYIDHSGLAGRTYYYKVKADASNQNATSAFSNPVSGKSRYVEDMNLSIHLDDNGKPFLTWGQLKAAKEYRIYRSTKETTGFSRIASTSSFSYTNTTVDENVTYYYKVKAVDSNGKVIQTSETLSIIPSLSHAEQLQTRYIAVPKIKLHAKPESSSSAISLRYMDKIRLGKAVITRESGTWYRVYYKGDLYYLLLKKGSKDLTRTQSDFTYTATTKFQQRLLNEALDLAINQKTVYVEGGSGELTADGAMGFDCSGMVSYLLNQTMRKWVPVYSVSSSMGVLSTTTDLYNTGYTGAFTVHRVTKIEDLQPGDVLFFRSQLDSNISAALGHCSIYLGNMEFIHCTSMWEDSVCIMPLAGDFEKDLLEIRRFLPETVTAAKESVKVSKACKVYERRNDTSPVLESLAAGKQVTILYISNSWAYVKTPAGNKGFIPARYIPAK